VVVVTADHGENLGEHDMVDHVFSLYEPTVQIPLLIRYPGSFAADLRVDAPVQLNDVYVTLANLTGMEKGAAQGLDLRDDDIPEERPILLSYDYPTQALSVMGTRADHPALDPYKRRLWALRVGPLKVIVGDDGRVELYDLSADPRELVDLTPSNPERSAALRRRLMELVDRAAVARDGAALGVALDSETAEELRRLGYLGDEEKDQ
jgi:arylsulfatase A-like enzyme